MVRRRKQQPELQPIYVRPIFERRDREAMRAWRRAAYCGERQTPAPGEFDPLWLRLGMRACMVEDRAGWVVSNPLYDRSLRANPQHDPSLPGEGWLMEVYRFWRGRQLTVLPCTGAVIEARRLALEQAQQSSAARVFQSASPSSEAEQGELFAEEVA